MADRLILISGTFLLFIFSMTTVILFNNEANNEAMAGNAANLLTKNDDRETQMPATAIGATTYVYGSKLIAQKSQTGTTYHMQDMLSTNTITTNQAGVLQSRYTSYPYGKALTKESTSGGVQKYTYTGKEDDGRLMYYGARYYDPRTGRFTSIDPALSTFANYDYAGANPIKYKDPTGKKLYATSASINDFEFLPMWSSDSSWNILEHGAALALNAINTIGNIASLPEAGMAAAGINHQDRQFANLLAGMATLGISATPGVAEYAAARLGRLGRRSALSQEAIQEQAMATQDRVVASSGDDTFRTVYRGTDHPDITQTAGGLRTGQFTLDELITSPPSALYKKSGDNSLARWYAAYEEDYGVEAARDYCLKCWGMDHSAYLSTAADKRVVMGAYDYVITAKVPTALTRDVEGGFRGILQTGGLEWGAGETEVGVMGLIKQDWIQSVEATGR